MHRLTLYALQNPRPIALLLLLVSVALAAGLPRLHTEFGYRVLIGDDHPSIQTLDRFIQQFGGGAPITIAWECGEGQPCKSVFDSSSLRMAESLRTRLVSLDTVSRIDGPSNSLLLVPGDGGFEARRFIENGELASDHESLVERALSDSLWVGTLVSKDGRVGALHVQASDTTSDTERRLVSAVQSALYELEADGFRYYLVGDSVATIVAGVSLSESMGRLIPLLVLTISVVIFLLTGCYRQTLAALATMGLALLWTFGLLGWLDWPQDGILEILPPLVLTVGVCDAIHLLSMLRGSERAGSREQAIYQAAIDVSPACTLTTLTTGAAFLSFSTSNLETFVRFGMISAFSVLACLLLTFSLLPLLCVWLRIDASRSESSSQLWERFLGAMLGAARERSGAILVATALILALGGLGWATRLEVDNDWLESLGEHSDVTRWVRFVEERLRDSEFLEVEVVSPDGETLGGAPAIAVVADLGTRLEEVEGLGRATSVADYVERLNRLMHDDDPGFERIPEDSMQTAQLLELLMIGDSSLLDPWMTPDRSRFRISVESPLRSYSSRVDILKSSRAVLDEHLPEGWAATQSGVLTINRDWVRDIQTTQLRSFPTAFLIVLVMVAFFLGSLRLGLLAMVPAVVAVVVTLGAMGWIALSLDVGRAMIAVVVIGIAVDDSIHLLTKYREFVASGDGPRDAVGKAVAHVGRAIVTTSLALAIGFMTLTFSAWQTISSFGLFVSLAILAALVATLFVVPAMIFRLDMAGAVPVRVDRARLSSRLARPSRRTLLTLLVVGPSLLALGIASANLVGRGVSHETECWLLPTGRVALIPGADCPLPAHAEIVQVRWPGQDPIRVQGFEAFERSLAAAGVSIQVAIDHRAETGWWPLEIHAIDSEARVRRLVSAVVICIFLLWLPMVLARRSGAPAAVPFACFYSSLGVITFAVVAARDSAWLNRAALLASTLGPAILVHLSFTFPRVRRFAVESFGLLAFPYVACASFFPVALWAMERRPLLWSTVVYLLLAASLAAWVILWLSCLFAIRESRSPREKARARLLVWSAVGLFVAAIPVTAGFASGAMASLALYLAFSVAAIPLSIGLAIGRYNLFNLRQDARLWSARLVFFSLWALLVTVLVGGSSWLRGTLRADELPIVFGLALLGLLVLERVRRRVLGWMEGLFAPDVDRLRSHQADYVEAIQELRTEEEVAGLLSRSLREALGATGAFVILAGREGWEAIGASVVDESRLRVLAERSRGLLGSGGLIQIADPFEDSASADAAPFFDAGIEVLASLTAAGEDLGVVLVGKRDGEGSLEPYAGHELDLVAVTVAHASMALRNARVARALLASERAAATGRTALALAHGVSKDVGLIRTLARRLAGGGLEARRGHRDLSMIEDLARELEGSVRGFVREAARGARSGTLPLGEAMQRALRVVARVHGAGRIRQAIEPGLKSLFVDVGVERVLTNLLDNALFASGPSQEVILSACLGADGLQIDVRDSGCGMNDAEIHNAFSLGYTTRREQGGFGVGLAVSRDLAEGLGGSVRLEPHPQGGTIATMRIPVPVAEA